MVMALGEWSSLPQLEPHAPHRCSVNACDTAGRERPHHGNAESTSKVDGSYKTARGPNLELDFKSIIATNLKVSFPCVLKFCFSGCFITFLCEHSERSSNSISINNITSALDECISDLNC